MRSTLVFFAGWCALFLTASAYAQASAPDAHQFTRDVIAHEGHIQRLGATRRAAMPNNNLRTVDFVSHMLRRADEPPPTCAIQRPRDVKSPRYRFWKLTCGGWVSYPENSAVLFVAFDRRGMRSYLIDGGGLAASAATNTSVDELRAAAIDLRYALDVDGIENVRAPKLRGESNHPPRASSGDLIVDEATARVANLLFPPAIAEALEEVDHLLVVSNGVVASIPFPLLPFGEGMMVDHMTVTVSAGMYDLDMIVAPWERDELSDMLVIADPVVPELSRWDVVPLPGARKEGREVAEALNANLLVGGEAQKSEVIRRSGDLDLLYIAAHGVSDPQNPVDGGLLMLAGSSEEEALWTGREIQTSAMARTQLVVLSACQTGLGMPHEGGMIGLARAFQKAGVPRVVMSLWSVDDASTYFMMTRFNSYLSEHRPAEALRLAMLEAREEFEEPRYWAAFTVFGTPR